jgi:hypothetical protein
MRHGHILKERKVIYWQLDDSPEGCSEKNRTDQVERDIEKRGEHLRRVDKMQEWQVETLGSQLTSVEMT